MSDVQRMSFMEVKRGTSVEKQPSCVSGVSLRLVPQLQGLRWELRFYRPLNHLGKMAERVSES